MYDCDLSCRWDWVINNEPEIMLLLEIKLFLHESTYLVSLLFVNVSLFLSFFVRMMVDKKGLVLGLKERIVFLNFKEVLCLIWIN
jgi:hypothetical protein